MRMTMRKGNTEVRKKTPEAVRVKKEKDLPGTSRLPDQQPTVRRNGEKQSSKISKLSQYFDFETTPDTEFRGKLGLIRDSVPLCAEFLSSEILHIQKVHQICAEFLNTLV